jgi:DNA repair protein RadC
VVNQAGVDELPLKKPRKSLRGTTPSLDSPSYHGHRQRLLDRYLSGGASAFHEYELIELLLTYAIPHKDTKPIARALLAHFGSIGALLHADIHAIAEAAELTPRSAALFSLLRDICAKVLKQRIVKGHVITNRNEVAEYLRFYFADRTDEYASVLFLDSAHRIIGVEVTAEGTVNQCAVYVRSVLEHALKRKAAAIILAHNHPAKTPRASASDWDITERLLRAGKAMDIPLLDHIIIAGPQIVSLRDDAKWPV